jgi:hypothetical protein
LIQRLGGLKHPHELELLDAKSDARLDLGHLHVGRRLGLVVDGNALAGAASGNQDLHAEIAEGRVTGSGLNGLARRGLRLVDRTERLLCGLARLGLRFRLAG